MKQTAVVINGKIWDSADSGVTWVENAAAPTKTWFGIAGSADFMKQTAIVYNGKIWDSADSGVTWVENDDAPTKFWFGIATSADFVKQTATVNNGKIWNTELASASPSASPSSLPSASPSAVPSSLPSASPSAVPSSVPSASPSAVPSFVPSASPSAVPSSLPSASPSALPSSAPSAAPTTGLVYTYNATDYSLTGDVVLAFKASMDASCCLCTKAAIDAFLLTYAAAITGEIKVELISCTATRRTTFIYEAEVIMPTTMSAQDAAISITSPGLLTSFNSYLNASSVATTVTSVSTSNMVVSQVDTSSSITTGWIIMLTLVCTIVMLGVLV